MKILSPAKLMILLMFFLLVYALCEFGGLTEHFNAFTLLGSESSSSIIVLNLLTVIFSYIIIKLIDTAVSKRKLDTNRNKTLIGFIKYVIVFITIVLVMQNLGYNFNALLALGGAGSLIVGLAAKDMISNIFGYITILLDRPFNIGDQIVCEQHKVSGIVKKIGIRTTELARADKKPMYVPNSIWTTASIINSSRKTNRELDIRIPLLCLDPDKLTTVTNKLKKYLEDLTAIDAKHGTHVYIDSVDNSGVSIRVLFYLQNISLNEYNTIKENILFRIINYTKDEGVSINILTKA